MSIIIGLSSWTAPLSPSGKSTELRAKRAELEGGRGRADFEPPRLRGISIYKLGRGGACWGIHVCDYTHP
eukprot:3522706-Pyramimonas_sp.AAC.1